MIDARRRKKASAVMACLLLTGMLACADEPKPEPGKEAPTPPSEIDVAKTTERIVQGAKAAGKRLGEKDTGDDTQRLQNEALKDIEELIRKAQEPPPKSDSSPTGGGSGGMGGSSQQQPMNGSGGQSKQPMGGGKESKQPMGGSKDSTQPMGGGDSSAARRERRERRNSQAKTEGKSTPQQQPWPNQPGQAQQGLAQAGMPNKLAPKGAAATMPPGLPEAYKDVWGHLPEKMRREMDLYFREQFMPRYGDLLRQYYSSLAERGSAK
jgi:hypothetical protein